MDEDNPNHVLLCAEINASGGVFEETPCNFRALWSGVNEVDWSVEVGTNSDAVKNSLNALITCVKDTDDETFKATIGNYLDIQSAIDYWIFQYVICGIDGLAKNMLLGTYDLQKWIVGAYDLDSTWGLHWDGQVWRGATTRCPEDYQEPYSLLFERISTLFADEVNARYVELRGGALSYANILGKFEKFAAEIGTEAYADDLIAFPDIPQGDSNNIWQIRNFVRARLAYTDPIFGIFADNMFTPGVDSSFYCTASGVTLPNGRIVVNEDGSLVGVDDGWGSNIVYRKTDYPNEHVTYTYSADFECIDGADAAEPTLIVQFHDADGNVVTSDATGLDYVDAYKGFFTWGSSYNISPPSEAVSFRVGFVFRAKPSTANATIKISNVSLTKPAT